MENLKWPKKFLPLSLEEERINNDFMRYWHEVLPKNNFYNLVEKFNQNYPVKHTSKEFLTTLEIGAGLGEHLHYERLNRAQREHYVALDLRANMVEQIRINFPEVKTVVADCQERQAFSDEYFDRILAIHVLEHLPHLPLAIKEMYRLCNKTKGSVSIVIPCEGGLAYSFARKISAQRIYEQRYHLPYKNFIEREHINVPAEILEELNPYFKIIHQQYFPFNIPFVHCNLAIGLTLRPLETRNKKGNR